MAIRFTITFIAYCFVSYVVCNIIPKETYSWYAGIWHGLFFLPNFFRSLFVDVKFKADFYTQGYNICHWIFSFVGSAIYVFANVYRIKEEPR